MNILKVCLEETVQKGRVFIVSQGEYEYVRIMCVLPRHVSKDWLLRNIGGRIYENKWQVATREDLASYAGMLKNYYSGELLRLLEQYANAPRGESTLVAQQIRDFYGDSCLICECLSSL